MWRRHLGLVPNAETACLGPRSELPCENKPPTFPDIIRKLGPRMSSRKLEPISRDQIENNTVVCPTFSPRNDRHPQTRKLHMTFVAVIGSYKKKVTLFTVRIQN